MNAIKRKSMHIMFVVAMAFCLLFAGKIQTNAATVAPTGVAQTEAGSSDVKVRWNTVMQNNINYYYRISDDASFAISKSGLTVGENWTSMSGLNCGTSYYVQIGTSTTYNNSEAPADTAWSDTVEVATVALDVNSDSIKLTDAGTTYMTLAWDAPTGANYYEIKYWLSEENIDSASTVSSETNSIQFTGLNKNSKYNVRIYSYRVTSAGYKAGYAYEYGSKNDINVLPTKVTGITNTKFSPDDYETTFSWDKLNTADGYQYYIYDNSGKKILSGKEGYYSLYLKSNKLKKDQFYRIKVRGYITLANNKVKYGEWSDVTYFAKSPNQKVSAKQSGKNIKVSWNKVTGATNYTVYVSNKPNSGYKKVGTVKKTSTTIKKYGKSSLKNGKTYYVKVVANKTVKVNGKNKTYKSTAYYNWSDYVTMKK